MESPMDLTYMRIISRSLHYLGSWPYQEFGEIRRPFIWRHHRFIFCWWFIILVLQLLYVRDNIHKLDIVAMGHTYIIILFSILGLQRITMPSTKSYREVTKMFVLEIHLLHHKHKSEYAMKVYKQVHRICTFFCYLGYTLIISCVIFYNIVPLMKNYLAGMFSSPRPDNGTFVVSLYYNMPFDYETNFIGYVTVCIHNVMLVADLAYVCLFDILVVAIVFHTWGHLKILDHNLKNFPRPQMKAQISCSSNIQFPPWYTPEESETVAQLLKDNIDHHRLLMNFVNKTSSAFGPMLCVFYAYHQVSDCILLLECSNWNVDALTQFLPPTIYLFQQLVQLSVIFELLGSKSETLMDAVYSVPWECMRRRERTTLLIFMYNVQHSPISVKALGMVPVGVRTMTAIIKTTFSYFLMLRTL